MAAVQSTVEKDTDQAEAKAVIQGEAHFSSKDRQTLMEMDITPFQAVFREGSDHHFFERKLTVGYTLFVVGYILYGATYGRFYRSSEAFEKKVLDADTPFYKIDADAPTIYEMIPRWNRTILLIGAPIFTFFFIGFSVVGLSAAFNFLGVSFPVWASVTGAMFFLLTYGLVWPLMFFLLLIGETMDARDEHMANNILRKSDESGYEQVLVSCGDGHRDGLSTRLKNHGWDTDPRPTKSRIGRAIYWLDRLSRVLLNPVHTIKQAAAWITRNRE